MSSIQLPPGANRENGPVVLSRQGGETLLRRKIENKNTSCFVLPDISAFAPGKLFWALWYGEKWALCPLKFGRGKLYYGYRPKKRRYYVP